MARRTSSRSTLSPTLTDVAKAAGVSPMTVSRVVNRDPKVRQSTRDRVKAAISALNYTPNQAARSLAGAAHARIALIYGNPSAAYLGEVLLGALQEADQSDARLVLERQKGDDFGALVKTMKSQRLDGAILPPPFSDSGELIAALRSARIPTALIASASPAPSAFSVAIDDHAAAKDMTAHLLAVGHRRIGFIIGNPNQTASAKRLQGYKSMLSEAGVAFDPALTARGDFTYRSGLAAAHKLLRLQPRPTAIFASNDDMAAATIAAAHALHLDIPRDLSVCGFDDTALSTTIAPALTTIRQPVAEMTMAAVAMLASAYRRRRQGAASPPEQRTFDHQLIRRRSVTAPSADGARGS